LLWAFFAQCVIDMVIKSLTGGGQIHLTRSCLCLELGDLHSAGEWLEVWLYWQGLAPMREDYTVFVHLTDETGRVVAQHDGWPQGGAYPFSVCDEGEVVVDEHPLALPTDLPAGSYGLRVGLYLLESGQRLLTESGADSVDLGQVELPGP